MAQFLRANGQLSAARASLAAVLAQCMLAQKDINAELHGSRFAASLVATAQLYLQAQQPVVALVYSRRKKAS